MVNDIEMKDVNKNVKNSLEKLRSFPGLTLKYSRYYVVSSLNDKTPSRTIFHGGCTDLNGISSTPEKIAKEIGYMKKLCRGYHVNDTIISVIICRRSKFLNERVNIVNILLKLICDDEAYFFIDNSNIENRDLRKGDNICQNQERLS